MPLQFSLWNRRLILKVGKLSKTFSCSFIFMVTTLRRERAPKNQYEYDFFTKNICEL